MFPWTTPCWMPCGRYAAAATLSRSTIFCTTRDCCRWFDLAQIIKVDLMQVGDAELSDHVRNLRPYKVKLLAEKVETWAQFRRCVGLGFDYFQGYFLCRPEVIQGRRLSPNRRAALHLLARLQDPDADLREIGDIISHDVPLTQCLLRAINSAKVYLPQRVDSISKAVLMLGTQYVARLASLVVLARLENQLQELLATTTTRARMCEMLGHKAGGDHPEAFFLVGMFSTLDAILGMPFPDFLNDFPLADRVRAALLNREGVLGQVLNCVIAFEHADWDAVERSGFERAAVQKSYFQAIDWAGQFTPQVM